MLAQRGAMAIGSLGNLGSILRPEIPQHQVGPVGRRKIGEPIDSAMLPNPVSGADMVGVSRFGETRSSRLFGGKKPLRRLRDLVELSGRLLIRSRHTQSLNIFEVLCSELPRKATGLLYHIHFVRLRAAQSLHFLEELCARSERTNPAFLYPPLLITSSLNWRTARASSSEE